MKHFIFSLTIIFYINSIVSMEAPPSTPITIIAKRTGNIDTSCTTQATLVQDKTCLAEIAYTLQGHIGQRQLLCAMGPIAYQNEVFLARITSMNIKEAHRSSLALLSFAIKDLKELHEKQDKSDIQNKTLYIDAVVTPGSYESSIFEFFGFKKVSNLAEQDILLLDPSSVVQERTKLCQEFLKSVSLIALKDKSDQNKELLQTPIPAAVKPTHATFPRAIRTVPGPQPEIRKSSRIKKSKCQSGAYPIHKKDLQ